MRCTRCVGGTLDGLRFSGAGQPAVMGIILRHVCWGTHRPPPPPWGPWRLTGRPPPPLFQNPKRFRTRLGSRT